MPTKISYNDGRCWLTFQPIGTGENSLVEIVANSAAGSMVVSKPRSQNDALKWALKFAGICDPSPSPDDAENYLSERLGF